MPPGSWAQLGKTNAKMETSTNQRAFGMVVRITLGGLFHSVAIPAARVSQPRTAPPM